MVMTPGCGGRSTARPGGTDDRRPRGAAVAVCGRAARLRRVGYSGGTCLLRQDHDHRVGVGPGPFNALVAASSAGRPLPRGRAAGRASSRRIARRTLTVESSEVRMTSTVTHGGP